MLRIFNTLTGQKEEFRPLKENTVGIYTCGPTVYDYAHIGNFRTYVFIDLLKKYLKFLGYRVVHVMNITDVDDKTIKGAISKGMSLKDYTNFYYERFLEDLETLRIEKADYFPKATEHIEDMVKIIKGILEKGFAYRRGDSIYFRISAFNDYGKLSKIQISADKVYSRIDSDEYDKELMSDFALWKGKKEGEPYWKTEIGEGRPGWHIECSTMSMKYLGETFDIHVGGIDLIFPHHENEIAQSESFTGKKFVNYWIHCNHLIVDGEKMSKSRGNFYTLRDLISMGRRPMAIRYLLLSTHYRNLLNFTFKGLSQADQTLQRIENFLFDVESAKKTERANPFINELIHKAEEGFRKGMDDDLNISIALSSIFEFIKDVNIELKERGISEEDKGKILDFVSKIDSIISVLPKREKELPSEIMKMIKEREEARKRKDFEKADRIREELRKMGIILEDTKEGVRWKILKKF
ncbi:MAG: cysteine--tRNA ligase [Candidatus Aminicenantia bacterium]